MVRLITSVALIAAGLASIYSAPVRRDIATVKADVESIKTQVIALDNSLRALSDTKPSLQAALNIDTAAQDLDATLLQAVADVQETLATDGLPSEADAAEIIATVASFKPTIISALTIIVAKKPAFAKLPIDANGLVRSDLTLLYQDTQAFEDALLSAAPDSLKPTGIDIVRSVGFAFSTALAAYGAPVVCVLYCDGPSGIPRKRGPNEIRGVPKAAKRVAAPAADTREFLRARRNAAKLA